VFDPNAVGRCASGARKLRYRTYGDALGALMRLEKDRPAEGVRSVYQCAACGDWHVSHKTFTLTKPKGRGKRRRRLVK
jgi:hypothetical protein